MSKSNINQNKNTIFTDTFPDLITQEDLNNLRNKEPFYNYDPYYIRCGIDPGIRSELNKMWKLFSLYADHHFLSDLKKHFHQRIWEMYVGYVLLSRSIQISSEDSGPDFTIRNKINIECVAPSLGDNIEIQKKDEKVHDVPNDVLQLRILNSIAEKKKQYAKWVKKGIINSSDPYILFVNTFIDGSPEGFPPRIIRVLYGVGDQYLSINTETLKANLFFYKQDKLINRNQAVVKKHIFSSPEYNFISAIAWSASSIINVFRKIGDDIVLIHNPCATNILGQKDLPMFPEYNL